MSIGHGWHARVKPYTCIRFEQNMKLVRQGGLHNTDNDDTCTYMSRSVISIIQFSKIQEKLVKSLNPSEINSRLN